jgi:hypothetical protein
MDIECPICLEEEQKWVKLPCGHFVCDKCHEKYLAYLNNQKEFSCPLCRQVIINVYEEDTENRKDYTCCILSILFGCFVCLIILTI